MTDDNDDLRDCLVDYIQYAHHALGQLLDEPGFPDRWHLTELRELSNAADEFTDMLKIMQHHTTDRGICNDLGIAYPDTRSDP